MSMPENTLLESFENVSEAERAFERIVEEQARSTAYVNYREVRTSVFRMLDSRTCSDGIFEPSAYWTEELEGFDYMFDASPLMIAKLRHQTYHLTGLKVYDYRTGKRDAEKFAAKIEALRALDRVGMLVPEARELGGFGFEIDGALYNIDTLKFYEVMIALDRGGVLGGLRQAARRNIVWEIGAGWGGFARVFKEVVPNTTYLIVDLPQVILFSATYLKALFPAAKTYIHDHPGRVPGYVWTNSDFVFIPHFRLEDLTPPYLDLTLNMVSFQEMTTEQVTAYVAKAHELGSPYLYSLNRRRSLYNTQLSSVPDIIGGKFWPHVIPVLDVQYTQMLDKARTANPEKKNPEKTKDEEGPGPYQHIVGWRKLEK